MVSFVVVEEELIPLLSPKPAEKMKLITVNYDEFESVTGVVEDKHDILQAFPDVFSEDNSLFLCSVQLTLKPDVEPITRFAHQKDHPLNYGIKLKKNLTS